MKRTNAAVFLLLVAFLICLPGSTFAENIEVGLPSDDGSDAFQVKDSSETTLMHVQSDGNVGIGTTSPTSQLEVAGDITFTNENDRVQYNSDNYIDIGQNGVRSSAGSAHILIDANNYPGANEIFSIGHESNNIGTADELFRVQENGNVGIGTATPDPFRLNVNGTANFSGNVTVAGTVDGVDLAAHASSPTAHHVPPTSLPPSGSAGGDLSGTYPNPSVNDDSHNHTNATLTSIACTKVTGNGVGCTDAYVNTGGDTVYGTIEYQGSWPVFKTSSGTSRGYIRANETQTQLDIRGVNSAVMITHDGTNGAFVLMNDVYIIGYAKLSLTSGSPPASDCDSAAERGRMKVDSGAGLLYVCVNSGWVTK